MGVLIDDREPDRLKNYDWGFNTETERLKVADYIVNNVGIERKEINDFVQSLEGRMWEQAMDLEDNDFDQSVIIVIGRISDLSTHNMGRRKITAVYGAIARLTVTYNVNVFWFREESQFKQMVKKLHSKAGTDASKKKPHLSKRNYRDDRINVLYGIHGIGFKTATNMLEEFGSVAAICSASEKDFRRVDGIGRKTAGKIYDILHEGENEEPLLQ